MKRAGLLKRFFNVLRGLMTKAQYHAVDRAGYIWRIIETARDRSLHPGARLLGGAPDAIAAAMIEDDAIFGVTHNQGPVNILAREIGAQVELAGIPRPVDWLSSAEQPNIVAEFHRMTPTDKEFRRRRAHFAVDR